MSKPLQRQPRKLTGWHDGLRGKINPDLRGDCSGLRGEISSDLRGDCTGLWGNLDEIPTNARPCDLADWVEEGS